MGLFKDDARSSSPISASFMSGEEGRRPVQRRPAGLTIRVREIDCMLADIQGHIQMLRRERAYLGLVREELAVVEAKRRTA
jgi:hypothetical protein